MVLFSRLEILTDGQEINLGCTQIIHQLQDFFAFLPQPNHDAGLGENGRVELLDLLQQADRVKVPRAGANLEIFRWHRLKIVIEHIGPRCNDSFECAVLAQEIRRENLNCRFGGATTDRSNRLGKMLRPTIGPTIVLVGGETFKLSLLLM